jgi:hypothetical protein
MDAAKSCMDAVAVGREKRAKSLHGAVILPHRDTVLRAGERSGPAGSGGWFSGTPGAGVQSFPRMDGGQVAATAQSLLEDFDEGNPYHSNERGDLTAIADYVILKIC